MPAAPLPEAAPPTLDQSSEEPLSLAVKIAFGAPNFAGAAMAIPIAVHLSIFYADVLLVPLGFIALAKAVARALDAITDPLMGWVSDRTRSSWGRRRPWLAIGAPLAALAFMALFSPPEGIERNAGAVWLASSYILYYLFHTVYAIPHYALGAELSLDYKERSSLFGWEQGFSVLGTMVAAVVPGLLIATMGHRPAYRVFAMMFGTILVLLYAHLIWRIRERPDFVNRPPNPLVPGVRRVLRNRVYRILLGVYFIASTTGAMPGMMMPFFTTYVIQPEDPSTWIAIYLGLYFGSGFLFLPLWVLAARRFGKKETYLASFVSGVTGAFALFFMGQGDVVLTGVILVWAGSSFGARLFLGPALQADVIDYDELYTGKRREAQYGSLWSFVTKFTVIPSMSLPLAALATLGYEPNTEQTETVQFAIRALFGLAPGLSGILAFGIACFYPITESAHRKIRAGIQAHARGESARDPLNGRLLAPPAHRGVEEQVGWFLDHFSRGELRRALVRGPNVVLRDTIFWCAFCIGLAFSAGWVAVGELGGFDRQPGVVAVAAIVVAGISLALGGFHGRRVAAARELCARPTDLGVIRAHLALDA